MKTLSETWFADGYIDFELKQYTILAYLQEVNKYFDEHKLYPQLADVIFHYNNLLHFKTNKDYLKQQFPRRLSALDMQKLTLLYESIIEDDAMMAELEEIIAYALGKLKGTIEGGTSLYEYVEERLEISPVGLVPLQHDEGYFFLQDGACTDTKVYQYRMSIFEKHREKYRSIKTEFVASWTRNFVNTAESIKTELIRHRTMLPNPAVYNIETSLTLPVEETLLPVAKRTLVKYLHEVQGSGNQGFA
jgi:benzoyl-CoA reductase/2-hydroxyglutaryl-CoA dehydratase subunit BcrC/BadD/HgdB